MRRDELWKQLIEAEVNVSYYELVCSVCRWIDAIVRLTLLAGCAGGLIAMFAVKKTEPVWTWIAFVAACLEVVIMPVLNWRKLCERAGKWRKQWIKIREEYYALWQKEFAYQEGADVDATAIYERVIKIDEEEGYCPKIPFVINHYAKQAARRYE